MQNVSVPARQVVARADLADHALEYAAQGSPGERPIVFIHGWPDSWRSFQPVMDWLPPESFSVSVSLRGFGGSTETDDGYSMPELAEDVARLLDQLTIDHAVVVAHSMGTMVAQCLAATRPDLVAGLVLIGGFARLDESLAAQVW